MTNKNWNEVNLSIIPTNLNKIPFGSWKEYQNSIAPIDKWYNHYLNNNSIGIITGKVSDNLECIDIDVKNDSKKTIMDELKALIPSEIYSKLLIQTTPNNGYHLIYRCNEVTIEPSQKLALEVNGETIIETRGEGGYFCTNKEKNKIIQGDFDLTNMNIEIPIITASERELLLESARSLNRFYESNSTKNKKEFTYSEPAINEFNDNFNIIEYFEKHEWSLVKEDDEKVFLLRKGSLAQHSAYYFKSTKTFINFSSSTPFTIGKPYNHFQVIQTLEGKNDYKTTLRILAFYGYNVQSKPKSDKITSADIANYLNQRNVRYDELIQELTIDGKIIEEMEYNTLYIDMKNHFDKEISRSRFEEIIKSNYIIKFNPLMEFINKNINRKPSGTFEQWLDCLELKNKNINKTILTKYVKKWYVGMIATALDYEFPNELFLTLISNEQGIGKTSWLRNHTLPSELNSYRKEHSLSFDDDFKIMMSQSLLIIDDEMDSRTYEADKTFKTVLSTKEMIMRRKFDRRLSSIKRRCSFCGSGNHLEVVREENNRRIIPVEIEKIYFDKLNKIDLIDLFMEAYHLLIGGFEYSYRVENQDELKELYTDYVLQSDLSVALTENVFLPSDDVESEFRMPSMELLSALVSKYPMLGRKINNVLIGKFMTERHFKKIRMNNNRITCYIINRDSPIISYIKCYDT